MQRGIDEDPAYVVFNGRDGAIAGDRALTAKVATVRILVTGGQPHQLVPRHWRDLRPCCCSSRLRVQHQRSNDSCCTRRSAVVDFKMEVPGTFIVVDHALFRTFHKGTFSMIKVTGDDNKIVYSGREVDEAYLGAEATCHRSGWCTWRGDLHRRVLDVSSA